LREINILLIGVELLGRCLGHLFLIVAVLVVASVFMSVVVLVVRVCLVVGLVMPLVIRLHALIMVPSAMGRFLVELEIVVFPELVAVLLLML